MLGVCWFIWSAYVCLRGRGKDLHVSRVFPHVIVRNRGIKKCASVNIRWLVASICLLTYLCGWIYKCVSGWKRKESCTIVKSVGVLGHSDDSADFFAALAALGATLDGVINQQSLKKKWFFSERSHWRQISEGWEIRYFFKHLVSCPGVLGFWPAPVQTIQRQHVKKEIYLCQIRGHNIRLNLWKNIRNMIYC